MSKAVAEPEPAGQYLGHKNNLNPILNNAWEI